MRLANIGVLVLALATVSCNEKHHSPQPSGTERHVQDEEELKRLQNEWMQAWVREDQRTLERILAPEYQLIVSSMPDRPISREQWLGLIGRYTAQGFEYEKMVVRLFGDTAVVSSLGHIAGAQVDGKDRSGTFFLTDVWRRRDGRWQVVSRYSSKAEGDTASAKALEAPAQ